VHGKRFRLQYVEANKANSAIRKGDRVVSSGLGGRFPKGILIGHIVEVRDQRRDPLFKEVFLESSVDFSRVEEVFVIRAGAN
jgi:rod shape-determining protein MreC